MTKTAADVRIVADQLAEAMSLGIDAAEVAPTAHRPTLTLLEEHPAPWCCVATSEGPPMPWHYREEPDAVTHIVRDARGALIVQCGQSAKMEGEKLARAVAAIPDREAEIASLRARNAELKTIIVGDPGWDALPATPLTVSDEHPAPWSYREELEGRPVPRHYREEPDAYTDDARRRHVVRDARGGVVAECVQFSKTAEENLARVIAAIPKRRAEIRRLRAALVDTLEVNRLKVLKEVARLRGHLAELQSIIIELNAKLRDELKTARQAEGDEELQGHPMPWDHKEEPDVGGDAL
jgi:hypothetical protein